MPSQVPCILQAGHSSAGGEQSKAKLAEHREDDDSGAQPAEQAPAIAEATLQEPDAQKGRHFQTTHASCPEGAKKCRRLDTKITRLAPVPLSCHATQRVKPVTLLITQVKCRHVQASAAGEASQESPKGQVHF